MAGKANVTTSSPGDMQFEEMASGLIGVELAVLRIPAFDPSSNSSSSAIPEARVGIIVCMPSRGRDVSPPVAVPMAVLHPVDLQLSNCSKLGPVSSFFVNFPLSAVDSIAGMLREWMVDRADVTASSFGEL